MQMSHAKKHSLPARLLMLAAVLMVAGCAQTPASAPSTSEQGNLSASNVLTLPELQPIESDGQALRVVATTSIIGDVVARVGGEDIALTTLMDPGSDPHSYQPVPRDLAAVAEADVIFVNGWDLEETLIGDLEDVAGSVPLIPVSANIQPLIVSQGEASQSGQQVDPHVWLSVDNVGQWVENIESVFSTLRPDQAESFRDNAANYLKELDRLQEKTTETLAEIPEDKRFLVTNHDSLAYFADAYGFTVIGTVIPGVSTMAEPSASDLAELITQMNQYGVCAIIADAATSASLAETVAAELQNCQDVQVVQLYTGSLGPPGSGADSYIGMFSTDVQRIGKALQ